MNLALCPRALALATSPAISHATGPAHTSSRSFQTSPLSVRSTIRHRGVAMKRLSGQRALEDRGRQFIQLEAKPVDVPLGQRGRWTQVGQQALEPVSNLAQRGQVTREVGERRMQSPQRATEFPWLRRRSLLVVWDEPPHGHPQPVVLVWPRRQEVGRRNDQVGPLGQEGTDGYLARQPLLDVIVQDRRPGHHARHNRCGLEMHQYVAARRDQHCLVAGDAVLTGNGLRGRERRGLAGPVGRVVWAAHAGSLVVTPIGNHWTRRRRSSGAFASSRSIASRPSWKCFHPS